MNDDLYCSTILGKAYKDFRIESDFADAMWHSDVVLCPTQKPAKNIPTTQTTMTLDPPEKPALLRNREINVNEARELELYGPLLRRRIRVANMEMPLEWLNENCVGLFLIWPQEDDLISFELDEDEVLFKLKFHMA